MGNPLQSPSDSAAYGAVDSFKGILLARSSQTTNQQSLADVLLFSTASPGSFSVGNHVAAASSGIIQKGTVVTYIDGNDIYLSKPLIGTLASGATVTTWTETTNAAGGPKAFELKEGSGISLAHSVGNHGATTVTVTASGGGTASAIAADDIEIGNAAVDIETTVGNITLDAQATDTDIIFKGTNALAGDITMLTLDGSANGKAIFNADIEVGADATIGDDLTLLSDGSILGFGTHTDVTLTHVHDTGLLLNAAMELQFRDSAISIGSSADGQLDIASDASMVAVSPTVDFTSATQFGVTTPSVIFASSASATPVLELRNTTEDTTSAELRFRKDKGAAGADGDDVGKITFIGDDAAQAQTNFGQILVEVSEADDTDEAGKMSLLVAESNGTTTALTAGLILEGQHATDGVVDVTIGAGIGSVTTIAGDLTVNGATTTISTAQLTVEDDLITVSKGNDSLANADGSGIEIECTGATNPSLTYQTIPAGWESNVHINLNSGKDYKINDVSILTATALNASVISASGLATVGALNAGSITSGFGTIDNGTSNITTGGLFSIDIDSASTINGSGGGIGAVGSITLGAGADAGLYVESDNLYIENKTLNKDIIFRVNDGGAFTTVATVDGDVSLFNIATGKLGINGTAVSSTAAELNLLDTAVAGSVVDSKAVIYSDAGQVKASTLSVDAVAIIDTSSTDAQSVGTGAAHPAFTYAYGTYRTAKFVYQITDGTDFESGEILVNYKGASEPAVSADIYLTQYATVSTKANNAAIVTWDAVKNSTNIELQFTNPTGGTLSYSYDVVNTLLIK
jgi:hypothetical protein